MNNTWIVVPVISNDVDLSAFVNNLSGGYVAPETYDYFTFNQQTKQLEKNTESHPYAGQTSYNFSNKIIFINKMAGYSQYDGVTNIEDFGDINIYRYWNTGLDYAVANGADSVVLVNGVIDFDPFLIKDAYDKFVSTNKEIINIADGAMLLIAATSTLRADEQFQIWFGDNDLYRRSETVLDSIASSYSSFEYIVDPFAIDSFDSIVTFDEQKYNVKWS